MWTLARGCALGCLLVIACDAALAQDDRAGRLELVESPARDELDGVVTSFITPDGKFLYASSWKAGTLDAFARDPKTGRLELKQTINDSEILGGATGLALSPDGDLAVTAAFQSKAIVLYLRDRTKGLLSRLDIARDSENDVRMGFPVGVAFAPDSQGIVVVDDFGTDQENRGAVISFRLVDGKLVLAGVDEGKDGCYAGVRSVAFHPDGKTLFVAADRAGTLVAAERDPATGRTSVRQVVKDEEGDVHGLAGAMGVAVSRDGRFVYVCSGRFRGDNAVSVFKLRHRRPARVRPGSHQWPGRADRLRGWQSTDDLAGRAKRLRGGHPIRQGRLLPPRPGHGQAESSSRRSPMGLRADRWAPWRSRSARTGNSSTYRPKTSGRSPSSGAWRASVKAGVRCSGVGRRRRQAASARRHGPRA